MAVVVEMHNTGHADAQRDVIALVEHVLTDHTGDWRVSVVGSQENDSWEMKIMGPNGFERSYTLEGAPKDARRVLGIAGNCVKRFHSNDPRMRCPVYQTF